ncbi:MAG: hypothetical protein K2L82_03035 [Lachnospiraceae bacterium]|nr:hypothetical protein [Lachnospiraceae bacterium]
MYIDEALNKIIFDFHLDKYYPHYRNMYEAEKILKNIIENIVRNNKRVIFVGDDKTGIAFVRHLSKDCPNIHFVHYNRDDRTLHNLSEIEWDEYEEIYLISYYKAEYVERWFRTKGIKARWIYDIFERGGVFFQREFFVFGKENMLPLVDEKVRTYSNRGYVEAMQCELYIQQSKYRNTDDSMIKRIALEKCLFLVICMRNFVLVEEYMLLLSEEDKQYIYLWKKISDLLAEIRAKVHNRKQRDIVLYWLDCMSYGDESDIKYLTNIMKDSVVFEEAYTNVGYTISTLRAMFLGKRDIDDRGYRISQITRNNSSVIQYLEERGYRIKIYSGILDENFPAEYSSEQFYLIHLEPFSKKLWDMMSDMLQEEQKTLYIVHAMETHGPYLSSRICDANIKDNNERYRLARQEIDEQLGFYDAMVNRGAFRIYMSDHGRSQVALERYHILFAVYHETLEAKKIEEMFSLLDFEKVLRQIIQDGKIEEHELRREYVEIGNLDWYNKEFIIKLFEKKTDLSMIFFGMKGIIDKQNVYLHYRTGQEWLQRREDAALSAPVLFYIGQDDICEPTLLMKYRKLAGEYPDDIVNDEKFIYSHYVYALYNNMLQHNNMNRRVDVINQLLNDYPEQSIAIRMGGNTSMVLYQILSKENRRKIWGFVDSNEICLCSRLSLPILSVDQIDRLSNIGIKAILMPSYLHSQMLRKESEMYPEDIDVLDIYDCLNRNGIECRSEFYKVSGTEEDYDVGFPVDI